MPQMMPMLWSMMLIFMILLIIITISFFYSTSLPPACLPTTNPLLSPSQIYFHKWSWKW